MFSNKNNDTPETDGVVFEAFAKGEIKSPFGMDVVPASFSRELERERNALRKHVQELKAEKIEGEMWRELMELIPKTHLVSPQRVDVIVGGRRISNAVGIVHFPDKHPKLDFVGTLAECLQFAREKWGKEVSHE